MLNTTEKKYLIYSPRSYSKVSKQEKLMIITGEGEISNIWCLMSEHTRAGSTELELNCLGWNK